jgi:transposase
VERVLHRRQLCAGQKGGPKVGPTKRGKGTKWLVLADGAGTPLGASWTRRPRRKSRSSTRRSPRRWLKHRRIQPIIPARSNNPRATDQDGRCLRRYRRRWIVERTIGWIGNFRRLTVRHDRLLETYGCFFHVACAMITLGKVLK